MTAEEAAMLMMSGSSPPTQSPLSLEGIKALKTLATVTVGDFVWECKTPVNMLYGYVTATNTRIDYLKYFPFLLNGVYAILLSRNICSDNYIRYTSDDGTEHLSTKKWIDFRVSGVGFEKVSSYGRISPKFSYSLYGTQLNMTDNIIDSQYESYQGDITLQTIDGQIRIANMSPREQYNFEASYLESEAANEPVINIL